MTHTPLQIAWLTPTELATYIGFDRELIINSVTREIYIMDGVTAGGFPVASKNYVNQQIGSALAPSIPRGRLTPTSGVSRPTVDVAGAATVYYTGAGGNTLPLYNGTNLYTAAFSELSNVLANSAVGNAGPVAVAPYDVFDLFAWDSVGDGTGTKILSRGPAWNVSSNVTMTIASPAVITWTGFPLREGDPIKFATSGALPTGITAGTVYFVGRSPGASTFNIATSQLNAAAGTFINTSGTQSGTHTASNNTTTRGTGSGSAELLLINGINLNKFAISNGPAASRGTWLGTCAANSAGTVDVTFGTDAAGGGEARICMWNAFQQIPQDWHVGDTTSTWTYSTATTRAMNAGATNGGLGNRVTFVTGAAITPIEILRGYWATLAAVAGAFAFVGYALNKTDLFTISETLSNPASVAVNRSANMADIVSPVLGLNYVQELERGDGTNVFTFSGSTQAKRFKGQLWW